MHHPVILHSNDNTVGHVLDDSQNGKTGYLPMVEPVRLTTKLLLITGMLSGMLYLECTRFYQLTVGQRDKIFGALDPDPKF